MLNATYEMFKGMVYGKKIAVLGIGVSNVPAIDFLFRHGGIITACDKNTADKFDEKTMEVLRKCCTFLKLGDNYLSDLDEFDIILKSPGINPSHPEIRKAAEAGVYITSEMEIFMSLCPCKIIAVTGSDGKTTTTSLIYEILRADGINCHVGGNIGTPLLGRLDYINETDYVVLELSSFQLMMMKQSPDISVVTNISPNHLDYHTDMNEYIEAKANIFKYQREDCKLIINADNAVTAGFAGREKGELVQFSRKHICKGAYVKEDKIYYNDEYIMNVSDIRLNGVHNLENYLAAVSAVHGLVDRETIVYVARNFKGVAHRMEHVRTLSGVDFYNDSIGSSPTRTIAGLKAHKGKIVLIAGGYDKKIPFDDLGKVIKERVSALVLCGATSEKIEAAVLASYRSSEKPLSMLKTQKFETAIKGAYAIAKSIVSETDDPVSVILSPACASFDMFKNFEIRGNTFKEIVNNLTE